MTRKIVMMDICKNRIWKETAYFLKLYKMKNVHDLKTYNIYSSALISLFRKTELEINKNIIYDKFEYRKKIKIMENEINKKLSKVT